MEFGKPLSEFRRPSLCLHLGHKLLSFRNVPLDFLLVQAFDAYEFERLAVARASESDFVLVNLFREPVGALRGRGRTGAVSRVRARGSPVRSLAAVARAREPGGSGPGLARPRPDRAHSAVGNQLEHVRGSDALWK